MWHYGYAIIEPIMLSIVILITILLTVYYKKIRQKKDCMVPFFMATISLIVGEAVKQIIAITVHPYDMNVLPLSVCASCLIWFSMVIFAPKGSRVQSIGYTMSYIITFAVTMMMVFTPKTIYGIRDDGNFFTSYNDFWSVYYHFVVVFCFLWLVIWRPYKIQWWDLLWAIIIGGIYSFIIGLAAQSTGINFATMMHDHPLKFMIPFKEKTWGYTMFGVFTQIIALFLIYVIYKFFVFNWIPKYGSMAYGYVFVRTKRVAIVVSNQVKMIHARIQHGRSHKHEEKVSAEQIKIKSQKKELSFTPRQHSLWLYQKSLMHILRSKVLWIMFFALLIICVFISFGMPMLLNFSGKGVQNYYATTIWVQYVIPFMFVGIAFFSGVVGEINSNLSERVYILSKSIKRRTFLICKILSALTITVAVTTFFFVILVLTKILLSVNHNPTIFRAGTTAWGLVLSYYSFCIFGTIFGSLMHYRIKGGLCSIIVLAAVLVYILVFMSALPFDAADNKNPNRLWFTSLAPVCIFFTSALAVGGAGTVLFMKEKINA